MPDPISTPFNFIFQAPVNLTVVIGPEYIGLPMTAVARQAFFDISRENLEKHGQSVISGLKEIWSYNLCLRVVIVIVLSINLLNIAKLI